MEDATTEKKLGEVEEGKEGPDVGEDRDEVTAERFVFRHIIVDLINFRPESQIGRSTKSGRILRRSGRILKLPKLNRPPPARVTGRRGWSKILAR